MLAKTHRLGRTDFGAIPKGTKGYSGKFMKIIPMFVSSGTTKMGIIVSRKQCGNAVKRTKIRRRLYAAFRTAGFLQIPSCYVLVLGRPSVFHAPFDELVEEVRCLLDRLK